jgi:RHS repeat-associated protein
MGFAGMERDTATGLDLAVFRAENPGTGRWDSQDPIGFSAGDMNLYRYVSNSPTSASDPTGLHRRHGMRPPSSTHPRRKPPKRQVPFIPTREWLIDISPIRGVYGYSGTSVHGGALPVQTVEIIGIGGVDADVGPSAGVIMAPGFGFGPVEANFGPEATLTSAGGSVTTIGLLNLRIGCADLGGWYDPVEGNVGIFGGGSVGPAGHGGFGGGGITISPGKLKKLFELLVRP